MVTPTVTPTGINERGTPHQDTALESGAGDADRTRDHLLGRQNQSSRGIRSYGHIRHQNAVFC